MSETPLDEQTKSKKPSSSAFKQQRLPAWQPILTAGTVLPTFFIIGIAFIPIGIGLLISSNNVQEYIIDYTDCTKAFPKPEETSCASALNNIPRAPCTCKIKFNLTEDYKGDVYMYYGLSNFYQNHRRYVKSRDDNQLLGNLNRKVSSDCEPFAYGNISYEAGGYPVAPCGAIANSLFNDTLTLSYDNGGVITPVDLLNTGIAWPTDKQVKFRNPKGNVSNGAAFENYLKPQNWQKYVWELDPSADDSNNGFQNEDLIVWMRTAALPTFRKLYRRVDHSKSNFKSGLPKGVYYLTIDYNYPVSSFKGSKRMILSTTSWLGGKNPFLGIAYIVVGCVCLVLGFVFLVIHIKFGKSAHDMVNITQKTGF